MSEAIIGETNHSSRSIGAVPRTASSWASATRASDELLKGLLGGSLGGYLIRLSVLSGIQTALF